MSIVSCTVNGIKPRQALINKINRLNVISACQLPSEVARPCCHYNQ